MDKYHDGESFLESFDRFDERAVVLDFDLSGGGDLNGLEVLEAIKERSPSTHVIFFSGQDSLEVAVESLKNGADDLHREVQRGLCIGKNVTGQGL